jgi:3-hydroxybutyryl-CoA dehydratase
VYFEELQVGQEFRGTWVTVTETHVVMFGSITGDLSPGHMNQEYMSRSPFGGRIAHGMLTASIAVASVYPDLSRHVATYLGCNFSFRDPVMLGDTIKTTCRIVELTPKSKWGLMRLRLTTTNQHGKTVLEGETAMGIRYRPEGH